MTITLAVLGVFVTYVPITGVAVSFDTIGRAIGASTSDIQWISDSYVIPMAAAVLSAGVFGDLYGRRRLYSLGMILTVIGAAVAGSSALTGDAALSLLWTGQAISGLGAGLLLPTTLALIAHAVPDPRERGTFVGMWASGMVVGLAVGPFLSGVILEFADWGWIYAPIGVLALAAGLFAHFRLAESKHPDGRHLDWPGQITATIAIAASIFGVIEGGAQGWDSPEAIVGLAVGGVALVAFLIVEWRVKSPLMDLKLFRSPAFSAAGFAAVIALFAVVGTIFLLSVFLGSVQHLGPLEIGVRLVFITGVTALVNPLVGRLMAKTDALVLLACGLALATVSTLLMTGLDESTGFGILTLWLVLFGISLSLMLTPLSVAAMNSVPWRQAGMASAANTALRQYGGALGPAVLGAVYVSTMSGGASPSVAIHAALMTNAVLLGIATVVSLLAALVRRRPAPAA